MALCICVCAHGAMHIHTDASDYRAGGRIWFRVHDFKVADEALFVELVNPRGVVAKRVKLLLWDGIFSGYMDIPTSCEAGQYLLRSYTRGMISHMDDAGTQIVYIHGRLSDEPSETDVSVHKVQSPDTAQLLRAPMPVRIIQEDGWIQLDIDTTQLLAGEHVSLSLSINDRYALSQHKQWTITEALARPVETPSFAAVMGSVVRGRVVTPVREKPIANAVVNMVVPGIYSYESDTTDEKGNFAFSDEAVPENMPALVSAYLPKENKIFTIRIEEDTFPAYKGIAPSLMQLGGAEVVRRFELNDITDSVMLEEIEVTAKRTYESKQEQHALHLADHSFGMKQIEEYHATCLHEVLRRVPGVNLVNGECYIRGAHSIYAKNPAAVAINGVIQEGGYDLDWIPMQDVARLDIFKSGTTVIWGARGGDGVISIILKDGSEIPERTDQSNLKPCRPLGWQEPADFHPEPAEGGRLPVTLFWTPDLRTATIRLPVVRATVYDILMEGTTDKGRVIHEKKEIDSSPRTATVGKPVP